MRAWILSGALTLVVGSPDLGAGAGNVTHSPTPHPTPAGTQPPPSTSKICLGPNEGSQAVNPAFVQEFCAHMTYKPGNDPTVNVRVTWGGKKVGDETISPVSDPHDICTPEKNGCKICLGFSEISITAEYAKVCPVAIVRCQFLSDMKVPMGCRTMGNEDADEIATISHGLTQFGLAVLKTMTLTRDMDTFTAPFSLANTLLTTSLACGGETRDQLLHALFLDVLEQDVKDLAESYGGLNNGMQHEDSWITSTCNSDLWVAQTYFQKISQSFLQNFGSFGKTQMVDMTDPEMATGEINGYIAEKTQQHMKKGIVNNLSDKTVMLFTNAVYFTANWEYPFDRVMTEKFHDAKGHHVDVDMMYTEPATFQVTLTPTMEMIEIPLKQDFSNFGFFVVRPRLESMKDTIEVEKELQTQEFQRFVDSSQDQEMEMALPVFTMHYTQDMTDELKSMGVKDVFDPHLANMTELFDDKVGNAYEDAFNRQGWIEVNQHGFEVAAFSGDGIGHEEATSGKVMHADKPLLFLIFDMSESTLMFAGRISNPQGWRMDEKAHPKHRASPFIVIFWVAFFGLIAYCGIMYCYNYQYEGVSGIEALPHHEYLEGCITGLLDCCEACWMRLSGAFGSEDNTVQPLLQEEPGDYSQLDAEDGNAYGHLDNDNMAAI